MRKSRLILWLTLSLIALGVGMFLTTYFQPINASHEEAIALSLTNIQYRAYNLPQSVAHTLTIPANNRFLVTVAVSPALKSIEDFAKENQAIAVINGGFFDPVNQKTTSFVTQQGILVADPRLNERFMNNPKNAPYLDKMLDRSEFRRYLCGETLRYDITSHNELPPENCRIIDALGGGPRLLPELNLIQEGFLEVIDGKVIRDALGSDRPNARSAIGITSKGDLLLIAIAQKPSHPQNTGISLPNLAEFLKYFGAEKAMNLDGGSSSSFYYQGQVFYSKLDANSNWVKRAIKSVLLVKNNYKD